MGIIEMSSKVQELRELRRMAEELAAEIEGLQDVLKNEMDARNVEEISGTDWRITYKTVISTRLDGAAIKKAMPELVERFTKTTTTRRFCIA